MREALMEVAMAIVKLAMAIEYDIEKICHIHQDGEAREFDLASKGTAVLVILAELLFMLPITPVGKTFWSCCDPDVKLFIFVLMAFSVVALFARLYSGVSCEFYDKNGNPVFWEEEVR